MTTSFSGINREKDIEKLSSEEFDLVIIGGGATGCGIALDAASRGMSVALIEKSDFASGTSSKSTKLIHGGLRYLKQLDIGLVRETGTERAIVHRLAPHLVIPEKMLLPIVKNGNYGKWAASFGVMIYDWVAGVTGPDKRKMLSKEETLTKEPMLDEKNLEGSCFYAEYRTDDARLTIEMIKRARSYGANAINYCEAVNFLLENDQVQGIKVRDVLTKQEFEIKGKHIVSAAGPWVDEIRTINKSKKGKQLHLSKGVHIVFSAEKLPIQHSIYFDNSDGRMIFAIPRGKAVYVGTTDTTYKGSLNRVVSTKKDAEYLINAINHSFPTANLTADDIESSWAGLRPLIHEDGKSPSELSRKDEIFESDTGLISIAGGKLTGYRKMAERIVDLIDEKLPKQYKPCVTNKIFLVEDTFRDLDEIQHYTYKVADKLKPYGASKDQATYLVNTYGKQTEIILNKLKDFDSKTQKTVLQAELWFTVQYEMVNTLEDFFIRRTGRLYFDINSISDALPLILDDLASYLNWSTSRIETEKQNLQQRIYDATHFYDNESVVVNS